MTSFLTRPADPTQDADAYVRSVRDSRPMLTRDQFRETPAEARRFLASAKPWAIYDEATSETVGFIGIQDGGGGKMGFVFYSVLPDRRRQGAGRAGLELVVAHAFEERGMEELYLFAHVDNVASQCLAERSGFRFERESQRMYADGFAVERRYIRTRGRVRG